MIKRTARALQWGILIFLAVNIFLIFVTNVPTHVTKSDTAIFRSILGLEKPSTKLSFDEEIELIRHYQAIVLKNAPMGEGIPEYQDREPEDLFRQGSGLCFDRSRTFDKLFAWAGLESRHIYILYLKHPITREHLPAWQAFLTKGTETHAVTEVKTKKGWLLVDSNSEWISLTRDGEPITPEQIASKQNDFDDIPEYFRRDYVAIRGMYSRRGQFYGNYILDTLVVRE